MKTFLWQALICAVAAAVLVGCAGGQGKLGTVPVSGTVTLDGQPVPGATVTFKPKSSDGRAASAVTDTNGRFTLTTVQGGDGALPGSYGVAITKVVSSGAGPVSDPRASGGTLTPEQMQQISQAGAGAGATGGAGANTLPAKYASSDTSGFSVEVKKGEKNDFEFSMTSN